MATQTTLRGVIPSSTTPIAAYKGLISNPWYFWLKALSDQTNNNSGNFIGNGSFGTLGQISLFEGILANRPVGVPGDIYFAIDNGTIYVNNAGNWTAMIPAFTGDITNTAGSNVLHLTNINPDVGTFFNATVTVNAQGRITAISNGSSAGGGSVGPPGTIQLAGSVPSSFDGNNQIFFFDGTTPTPTLDIGNVSDPLLIGPVINLYGPPGVGNYAVINSNTGLHLTGVEGI